MRLINFLKKVAFLCSLFILFIFIQNYLINNHTFIQKVYATCMDFSEHDKYSCPANKPFCIDKECYADRNPVGGICGENDDCNSNICIKNICSATKNNNGAVCGENDDCQYNICALDSICGLPQNNICQNDSDCRDFSCKIPASGGSVKYCIGTGNTPSSPGGGTPSGGGSNGSPPNITKTCESLSPQQCTTRSDCFYYAGGVHEGARCVSGSNSGSKCNTSADPIVSSYCYPPNSDGTGGQTCTNGACYGNAGSWCGSTSVGSHNEWCAPGIFCQVNYPTGPEFYCTSKGATKAPPAIEQCNLTTNCSSNQFCIGSNGNSSCVDKGKGGLGSLCESYTVKGSPVDAVCASGKCNTSSLTCTGSGPGDPGGQDAPGTNRMSDVGYCADGQRNSSDQSKAIPVNNPKCTLNEATSPNSTNAYCLQQSQLKYQNGSAAYFYTCPTTPGGNSGTSSNCSSIILKTVGGASMCNTKPGCYISTNGEFTYPTCKADEDKGVPCGQLDGVQSYCNNSQTCIKNSPYVSCRDNGTVQPGGDANNSCKALNLDGSVKADNSVCASGVCNATTYTCDPIKNPGTTTDTTPCASHKGISSYVNGTCDHQLFNAADYTAGKFCSTKAYYDRYICMDGTTIDFPVPASDHVCHETAWCPIGGGTGPAPVCRADCAAMKDPNGNPYSCTPDYNSTGSTTGTNSCCPDGKRFCSIAGSCVSATQGCGGLLAGIGQTCGDTNQCADAAAGAKCLPFGSSKACQWPGGTPPTPTAGASTNCSTLGRYGAGCGCSNGSGCGYDSNGSPLGCYAAIDNPNELYCAPVGQRWCTKSHTIQSNLEACNGSMAFITPTPTPNLGYLNDCPGPIYPSAPGGNQCQAGPTCTSGFSHNTKVGPGGTTGDQACSAAGIGNICCTHDTSSPATGGSAGGTAGGSTGSTTPTDAPGCPSDNINTCSDTACAPGKQNNGVGADAACQNINPATGKAYGQYCCKK